MNTVQVRVLVCSSTNATWCEAATTLLDSYGIADLTMRRLARELDVSPGALYWHFANKQQLLGAVADRILESVDDVPADWRERITGICATLRDALLSHTDGAELVSASFAAGQSEAMKNIVARLTDACTETAVGAAHAELAARTVVYYVLGFTVDEQSRLQWDAAGAELPDEQSVLTDDANARFRFGVRPARQRHRRRDQRFAGKVRVATCKTCISTWGRRQRVASDT